MHFEFATAGRIVFGNGVVDRIGEIVRSFGQHALVVTGRDPDRAGRLLASLQAGGKNAVTFSVAGEPDLATVERGVALAKAGQCDFVVAFGGGSVMDAAKAIAAMLTNVGELLDYVEVIGRGKALTQASAPLIAIPTTAGTGSEVTRNAVLASPEHKVKVSLRSSLMLPRVAVIDPELTYALPPALTASTGLDALTQLLEPYVCRRANPLTDALCMDGIQRVARSLRTAFLNGHDARAREDMALASLYGGLALANAGLGAVHGFAGPIGGMFPAPHGAVCAALLPHVMAANLRALREREPGSSVLRRYEQMAQVLTGNAGASADDGVDWVRQLVTDLLIPRLGSYGLKPEHASEVVAKAAAASSMKANPITLVEKELVTTLRAAL
jgi:alcohol dehydrogenase class IV